MLSCLMISSKEVSHHFLRRVVAFFEVFGFDSLGVSSSASFGAVDRSLQFLLREYWNVFTFVFTTIAFVHFFRIVLFLRWVFHSLQDCRIFVQLFHRLVLCHLQVSHRTEYRLL